ncbi:MAG TPA: hypothetical protein PKW63_18270 [Vicinamibacterales bacterium]|nr:hypothetical protein [Vicinamibacterales bacterium]
MTASLLLQAATAASPKTRDRRVTFVSTVPLYADGAEPSSECDMLSQ